MRITFQDLVVTLAPEQMATLLEDWAWLVGPHVRPCLVTTAGDVYFADADGAVHVLDIEEALYEKVAESIDAFEAGLRDAATAQRWLGVERYVRWRKAERTLAVGQFFCFSKPLCLGGEDSEENVEAADPVVAVSMLGQIHDQLRNLPDGASIRDIKFS